VWRQASFCKKYKATCSSTQLGVAYADCAAEVASMEPGTYLSEMASDTLSCREYHLSAAQTDAQTHCPHASKKGGNVCVKFEQPVTAATTTSAGCKPFVRFGAGRVLGNYRTSVPGATTEAACRKVCLAAAAPGSVVTGKVLVNGCQAFAFSIGVSDEVRCQLSWKLGGATNGPAAVENENAEHAKYDFFNRDPTCTPTATPAPAGTTCPTAVLQGEGRVHAAYRTLKEEATTMSKCLAACVAADCKALAFAEDLRGDLRCQLSSMPAVSTVLYAIGARQNTNANHERWDFFNVVAGPCMRN